MAFGIDHRPRLETNHWAGTTCERVAQTQRWSLGQVWLRAQVNFPCVAVANLTTEIRVKELS